MITNKTEKNKTTKEILKAMRTGESRADFTEYLKELEEPSKNPTKNEQQEEV